MRPTLLLSSLLLLVACGSGPEADNAAPGAAPGAATSSAAEGADPVAALRAHTAEFMARPEHDADRVQVRHLLVSFGGTGTSATRSRAEAETLAAELYGRAVAGEDFAALVKAHSDDSPDGVYTMVQSGGRRPTTWNRHEMVPAFGDAGWRLQPGELGVVAFDPVASPFGWHLVQRLE